MLWEIGFDSYGNHNENFHRMYIEWIGKEIHYRYQWITNNINNPGDTGHNLQEKDGTHHKTTGVMLYLTGHSFK